MKNITKEDYKFVSVEPDVTFDPDRNKRIIAETIKTSKILQTRKKREYMDKFKERGQAVSQYLTSLNSGDTKSEVADYFGRHEMARLRGEEIRDLIRAKIGDEIKKKIKTNIAKN